RAVRECRGLAARPAGIRGHLPGPGQVVRVHVVEMRFGIEGLSSPFSAAIEAREHDRGLLDRERDDLSLAAKRLELLQGPRLCRGRALGQQVLREELTGERLRQGWDGL